MYVYSIRITKIEHIVQNFTYTCTRYVFRIRTRSAKFSESAMPWTKEHAAIIRDNKVEERFTTQVCMINEYGLSRRTSSYCWWNIVKNVSFRINIYDARNIFLIRQTFVYR